MITDRRLTLSSYASRLLSEGRIAFSANEAEQALGVTRLLLLIGQQINNPVL